LLDEIQNLNNWELWVGKLYRRGFNLVIIGSNARLWSHKMASSLTGRFLQISVFPFSYPEILKSEGILLSSQDQNSPGKLGVIQGLLDAFLRNGGFPETDLNPAILKNYLSSLFDSILLKDILKRFRICQTQQLYDLTNDLLANYTNQYYFNQLKDDLQFNSVATVQLKREVDALIEAASELSCNNLLIITWDREETIEKNGLSLQMIPTFKWLCDKTYQA